MGQQPNLELTESDLPRGRLQPGPARRWRPIKPGLVTAPEENPTGGMFGHIGPDHGYALRLISGFELPDDDPDLRAVVAGLAQARAAALGRAAVNEDIEVALMLCGYWPESPPSLVERRERWLAAAPHDRRPGQTAVADVDDADLILKPDQLRAVLRRT
ncbi:MAG: hypothetical protein ACFCU2_13070 [Acidimicrobiia bacterium]